MVNAEAAIPVESLSRPRWRRRLSVNLRRWKRRLIPFVEIGAVIAFAAVALASYFIIKGQTTPDRWLSPPSVAALLVANLVPAVALIILLARRTARRRAAQSPLTGRRRLHVRLVVLFSVIASVPAVLVVIFASLLFESGMNFWFSGPTRTVITSARDVAAEYRLEQLNQVQLQVLTMGGDVVERINRLGFNDPHFGDFMLQQTANRYLVDTALLTVDRQNRLQIHGAVNLYNRPIEHRFSRAALLAMRPGDIKTAEQGDRIEAILRLDADIPVYFYGARPVNVHLLNLARETQQASNEYQTVLDRSRNFQIKFNVVLIIVSLFLVALAIWIALNLADRLLRPVGQLVDAARRVTAGDLSARVEDSRTRDEIATLGNAFNRMTGRLEEQTGALVSANAQLESRRAFIEAVLSGVTAGVISVDDNHVVRLINRSAEALLRTAGESPVGRKLAALAPELDAHIDAESGEDIVQLASRGEPRTLAIKIARVEGGHVLTFDDITEQLLDQRRAAWSDVARRIAHEIKNPLTPIQLAAERLQRRYSGEIDSDRATFERLTGTIVRQVGDLRRMVDEFSSFARMPKPVFREEPLNEIARQALFLHEIAHPDIAFTLDAPEPSPLLVCDRRLLGQALINVVKNGVEAIQQKREDRPDGGHARDEAPSDRIAMTVRVDGDRVEIDVADTGIGLPADRGRLTEPYMTTRAKGTGLGLAIVKKIVEEHFGQVSFADAPAGGSLVRFQFDAALLARLGGTGAPQRQSEEQPVK